MAPRVTFRPDVEGLRAVAVVLVVAFHAGVPLLDGGFVGVDVFFVISGFLITGLIIDELLKTGTVSIGNFYARRVRRLLPAACTVLVATALVFRAILPALDQEALAGDLVAAALWFANWHFAASSTDYFGAAAEHSPVLHYWSLSVEEQFYLVWPLLVLLVAGRRASRGPHTNGLRLPSPRTVVRRVAVVMLPLGAVSLTLSVLTTASSGPYAYFGVHTRAWELAAGGAVALARGYLYRLSTAGAAFLGWAGLALLGASAVLVDGSTPFPGVAALLPVAGAAAVLAAGARTQSGVASVLGRSVPTFLGRISYSWYLWHWPCLEVARRLSAGPSTDDFTPPEADPAALAVAVAASFLLAVATYRLVEQPFRLSRLLARSRPRTFALTAVLVGLAVVLPLRVLGTADGGAVAATAAGAPARPLLPAPTGTSSASGPLRGDEVATVVARSFAGRGEAKAPTMTPEQARNDRVGARDCFVGFEGTKAPSDCRFGDPDGSKVLVLVGDSHAEHWLPAFDAAAKARSWQLYFWGKAACGYADVPQYAGVFKREYTECATWRAAVLDRVRAIPRVDAVFVGRSLTYFGQLMQGGDRVDEEDSAPVWAAGAERTLGTLASSAERVVLMRDVPRPGEDVPACLSANPRSPDTCRYPAEGHVDADRDLFAAERAAVAGVRGSVLDLSPVVCSTDPCPVLSPGGAVLFRDEHHLTEAFSRESAPVVARALALSLARPRTADG